MEELNGDQELEKQRHPENFEPWCEFCEGDCEVLGGLRPCCGCHDFDAEPMDMYNYVDINV